MIIFFIMKRSYFVNLLDIFDLLSLTKLIDYSGISHQNGRIFAFHKKAKCKEYLTQ